MSSWRTLLATLMSLLWRRRSVVQPSAHPNRAIGTPDPVVAQAEAVAQPQDHCPPATRRASVVAPATNPKRDARVLLGPRVDGSTSWEIAAPPRGWPPALARMRDLARQGKRSCEAIDQFGECVSLGLAWAKGSLIVQTGFVRVNLVANRHVELQVTALAVETEGLVSWTMREVPRWVWWATGLDVAGSSDWQQLEPRLVGLVEQRRIEICSDLVGLNLEHRFSNGRGIEDALICGRSKVAPHVPRPGVRTGYLIGGRRRNEWSAALYRKLLQLAACHGPEKGALLEHFRAAGWDGEEDITRIEMRPDGDALVLVDAQGEVLVNGKRPLAALHEGVVQALWHHGLGKIWIADLDRGAVRERDNQVWAPWQVARDAARNVQPFRARRAARRAQFASVEKHVVERLEQALADIEVLRGTQLFEDVGPVATAEVERALSSPNARDRFTRATARHGDLVRASQDETDQ